MWLEESHHGSHEVPSEIDGCQKGDCLNRDVVLEQYLDVVHQSCLLCRILLSCELSALLQFALQIPGDEGHYKQREKDNT